MPDQNPNAAPGRQFTARHARLQRLAHISGAQSYLEIGVFKGATFLSLQGLKRKVAVDPRFKFDTRAALEDPAVRLFEMTSDRFFATEAAALGRFDLIYIDGLHEFAQSFRDFCACVSLLNPGGMILIDDTVPQNPAQAHPSQAKAVAYKPAFGDTTGKWMGDVFKTVFAIHDFFPQFSLATFPDHGQTLVLPKPRPGFQPIFNSLERIERMSFLDFLDHQPQIMAAMTYEAIFEEVAALYPSRPSPA